MRIEPGPAVDRHAATPTDIAALLGRVAMLTRLRARRTASAAWLARSPQPAAAWARYALAIALVAVATVISRGSTRT